MAPRKTVHRQWRLNYERLSEFFQEHKHSNLPFNDPKYHVLAKWSSAQRQRELRGFMSEEEKGLLDKLNFRWAGMQRMQMINGEFPKHESSWTEQYEKLKAYKMEHGDTNVPQSANADPKLAIWVANQRKMNNKGKLKQDRKDLLDEIDFQWCMKVMKGRKPNTKHVDKKWKEMYKRLLQFKKEHGHANVPFTYHNDSSLARWVANQRRVYHKKTWNDQLEMRQDRINLLNKIGFRWGTNAKNDTRRIPPKRKHVEIDSDATDDNEDVVEHHLTVRKSPRRGRSTDKSEGVVEQKLPVRRSPRKGRSTDKSEGVVGQQLTGRKRPRRVRSTEKNEGLVEQQLTVQKRPRRGRSADKKGVIEQQLPVRKSPRKGRSTDKNEDMVEQQLTVQKRPRRGMGRNRAHKEDSLYHQSSSSSQSKETFQSDSCDSVVKERIEADNPSTDYSEWIYDGNGATRTIAQAVEI